PPAQVAAYAWKPARPAPPSVDPADAGVAVYQDAVAGLVVAPDRHNLSLEITGRGGACSAFLWRSLPYLSHRCSVCVTFLQRSKAAQLVVADWLGPNRTRKP